MSWRAEAVADSGNWVGNALRFATREEAEAYLADLASRWISARETRIVECNDPVNYSWMEGGAVRVQSAVS